MHREQQDVLVLSDAQQARAHERPGRQIERALRLLLGQFFSLQHPLRLRQRQRRQVGLRQFQCERGVDDLHRHVVDQGERGAQHVMASHDFIERALQHLGVEPLSAW
jgi:hypothetical protein